MKRLNLDHWFVGDNELSIALLHYHVSIKVNPDTSDLSFIAKINNGNMEYLNLPFKTLESAMEFTENRVSKCISLEEVNRQYKEDYQGKVKSIGSL